MIDPLAQADRDDVLAQPTRAWLCALLGELRRPGTTAELAKRVELHPNGVRLHLERLDQPELVQRARAQSEPGRPPDGWTIAPGARPGGHPPSAYHDLGRWLARALAARPGGLRGIERTGREIGRELAPDHGVGPDALTAVLASLGFAPTIERTGDASATLRPCNCLYRDAVRENQPAICALHKGITRGLLDVLESDAKLAAFVPHDPDQAGCVVELRGSRRAAAVR